MKIRRYVGKDINEAMLKVKLDLGDNAVVVSTGTIREKGFWAFFKRPEVEVLAIVDENIATAVRATDSVATDIPTMDPVISDSATDIMNKQDFYTTKDVSEEVKADAMDDYVIDDQEAIRRIWQEGYSAKCDIDDKDKKINELEEKIANIEKMLKNVSNNTMNVDNMLSGDEYKPYKMFTGNLMRNEVEPQIVKKIIDNIKSKADKNTNVTDIALKLDNVIKDFLGEPACIDVQSTKKGNVILFAGPTGVGKTTTIAKIASDFVLKQHKSVALITADTYRIAAVEQLKVYAQILNIPLKVIYSAKEVADAVNVFADKDIILVDTAGRNHKNQEQFAQLKELVSCIKPTDTYLLISASTGSKDCHEIIDSYAFLPNYKILFTKLDETSSYGIILNVKGMTDRPLSYVTTGQNVPSDIEKINVEKISKMLLGSNIE